MRGREEGGGAASSSSSPSSSFSSLKMFFKKVNVHDPNSLEAKLHVDVGIFFISVSRLSLCFPHFLAVSESPFAFCASV